MRDHLHRTRLAAAQWFAAARACGSDLDICYAYQPDASSVLYWHNLPHERYDGIGGLVHLMQLQSARCIPPKTAYKCRAVLRPLLQSFRWSMRQSAVPRGIRADWLPVNIASDIACDEPYKQAAADPEIMPAWEAKDRLAWAFFSTQQTAQLKAMAQAQSVSVNTWLLKHLDAAIRPCLRNTAITVPWMIPVNMRGIEWHKRATANHVSSVTALVSPDKPVRSIHAGIRDALARGEHRANSLLLRLAGSLSARQKRRFLLRDYQRANGSIGAFSNLGSWPELPGAQPGSWLFCPPVVRGQLLGAGAVTVAGKLGLCLQVHPDVPRPETLVSLWIRRWVVAALGIG